MRRNTHGSIGKKWVSCFFLFVCNRYNSFNHSPCFFYRTPADDLNHGTAVIVDLCKEYANTDQLVVADSYFASVQSVIELKKNGLHFIGVMKTAVKQFLMSYLANVQLLGSKGDHHGLLSLDKETGTQLCAFVWFDRERRYFIATSLSLAEGAPVVQH